MSVQQSDADSSFDWTIINKGSDNETAQEHGDVLQSPLTEGDIPDGTVADKGVLETLIASELAGGPEFADEELLSLSDHSDIVSLDYLKESRDVEDDKELYFGEACSSQYTFSRSNPVLHTSSSEDQAKKSPATALRRRRLRRNMASMDEDDSLPAASHVPNQVVNSCGILVLLIVLIVSLECLVPLFAGNMRLPDTHGKPPGLRLDKLEDIWELLETRIPFQELELMDDQKVFALLVKALLSLHKENQKFQALQNYQKSLDIMWKEDQHKRTDDLLIQQREALASMQRELRSLHSRSQCSAMKGVVPLQTEVKRLKLKLVRQKQISRSFDSQWEVIQAEAEALRNRLGSEERVRDVLKHKINGLKTKKMEEEDELQKLKSHLDVLKEKLNYEQQRSDMWQRLYLQTRQTEKEDKRSGPQGMAQKLKKTFESFKNSARQFVRKQKENLKKAKDAVTANLSNFFLLFFRGTAPVKKQAFQMQLRNYLEQVGLEHNWTEVRVFASKFFRNGVFAHDQMSFKAFLGRLERCIIGMNCSKS